MDQIQKISEAGASTVLEVVSVWIFLPVIAFFVIAWGLKLRGHLFSLVFFIFLFSVGYVFVTYGLPTIPELYHDKFGS